MGDSYKLSSQHRPKICHYSPQHFKRHRKQGREIPLVLEAVSSIRVLNNANLAQGRVKELVRGHDLNAARTRSPRQELRETARVYWQQTKAF